ncbi:hypothetical protein FA15DRAFT_683542 [Coprinopsis marcescibilis]|uniref:Tc1-like transposase DDE domain-containing protein n=1 Tax=Coprinopsis marcescibilis TaxID=230819 RepID=A0A5C3KBQ0_COPMA|nr:hypothetical protein FA15DRAFT_683542 [Coprinopsis marcescibilis]
MSWVWSGEQPLLKKGTLEYGKNYDGYWTGALFAAQLKERIIPAFEKAHGPEYQALIMVDNSQGHSVYAEDALLTSWMNLNPGGKQAKLCNGWFMKDGTQVEQAMVFPLDHPEYPGQAKGMKQRAKLLMCCKNTKPKEGDNIGAEKGKCKPESVDFCAKQILDLQPDFKEEKSLVQEIIMEAGHLCIFLPKFHCELNFIEYFWGAVNRYLRENCNYTFTGLQENMPKALASVPVTTIQKWEN